MIPWRALVAVTCLLLGGCLATFKDPIPANEAAPIPLLGEWTRKDEWGVQQFLDIRRAGSNLYQARVYSESADNLAGADEYGFTVAHHGRRWYLSAGLPKKFGGNFAIGGFELTDNGELLVYTLDIERILQDIQGGMLQGRRVETAEGDGALIDSPWPAVFAYLDDPANSDVFVEAARYQRLGQ
ncbi:hypothetical protein [Pseudomonas sp. PS02288]|uniref:hypothetical protein n=1 Tax=Pseudomonas sp. PS02288 TaxID=2991443 RepID=UPI00249BC173|nr:hypothetical protein [Pseudomonas sp. PS02288]